MSKEKKHHSEKLIFQEENTIEMKIKSLYRFEESYKKYILMDEEKAILEAMGEKFYGNGKVVLSMSPEPKIALKGEYSLDKNNNSPDFGADGNDKFFIAGKNIEGFVSSQVSNSRYFDIHWVPTEECIDATGHNNTKLEYGHLYLFNFIENNDHLLRRPAKLLSEEWDIYINETRDISNQINLLQKKGGFFFTNTVIAKKANGKFTGGEFKDLINKFNYFFSFIKGKWCKTICPVGYDSKSKPIWQSWNAPVTVARNCHSLIARYEYYVDSDPYEFAEQLEELCPKFMHKFKDGELKDALEEAISCYISANSSRIDIRIRIPIVQIAFERLSYEHAVNREKIFSKEGYDNLDADDKFRVLFTMLNIPLSIPYNMKNMRSHQGKSWIDSPTALMKIRDMLVHPETGERKKIEKCLNEAWHLSLWYLEMSILALCEYNGKYTNRLTNKNDIVPWAKESENP